MKNAAHILLLDENSDTRRRISFLLNLSGYEVTTFRNRAEAANWFCNARQTPMHCDLLVINYLDDSIKGFSLNGLLDSLNLEVRVLLLSRVATGRYSTKHTENLDNRADCLIGSPENLLETIDKILSSSTSGLAVASH